MLQPFPRAGLAFLLAMSLAGCGSNPSLSGKVTLDGAAVDQGTVVFVPAGGQPGVATGAAIRQGGYEVVGAAGLKPGRYTAQVRGVVRKTGRKVKASPPATGWMDEQVEAVPPRFGIASTLEVEVKPGANRFDIDMTSARR